jgi:hypothetical protein
MAHFAKVEKGVVLQVVVVPDEHEENGQEYLNSLGIEGTWIQTSYNANFRARYAAIGDRYDSETDTFKPSQPGPEYVWDENLWSWVLEES